MFILNKEIFDNDKTFKYAQSYSLKPLSGRLF